MIETRKDRQEREQVCRIARSWIGTPYHHEEIVRGQGVDCATLLQQVYAAAKLIPSGVRLPHYASQWHLHRKEEKLVGVVSQFAREVDRDPMPGDIICWKFYYLHCHGSICMNPPMIVHADLNSRAVVEEDLTTAKWLTTVNERTPEQGQPRSRRVFTFWPREQNQ